MTKQTTRQITEYTRLLSQILYDVIEVSFFDELDSDQLTKSQFTILKILSVSDTSTVSEIADILRISRAAASKNVEKLVRLKLVKRKIIKSDRRAVQIVLSDSGRSIVDAYEELRFQRQDAALKSFSEEDREHFSELLGKFVTQCLAQEKEIDFICLQCNGSIKNGCALISNEERCRFYYRLNNNNHNKKED